MIYFFKGGLPVPVPVAVAVSSSVVVLPPSTPTCCDPEVVASRGRGGVESLLPLNCRGAGADRFPAVFTSGGDLLRAVRRDKSGERVEEVAVEVDGGGVDPSGEDGVGPGGESDTAADETMKSEQRDS